MCSLKKKCFKRYFLITFILWCNFVKWQWCIQTTFSPTPSLAVADISIAGESTVTMGRLSTFTCLVACIPTCSITWQYMGKTFQGDQVNIPILHQGNTTYIENKLHVTFSNYPTSKIEPLTCVATNTESLATITATMNLTVIGESVILLPPDF